MKLIFITIFRKTYLLACFLIIAYHIFYFDICDLPYIFFIQIAQLAIAIIEFTGLILNLKYPHLYPKSLLPEVNPKIRESYYFMVRLYCYSLTIYLFLPKHYIWPNYLIMILSGLLVGYWITIKASHFSNKLKKQLDNTRLV